MLTKIVLNQLENFKGCSNPKFRDRNLDGLSRG